MGLVKRLCALPFLLLFFLVPGCSPSQNDAEKTAGKICDCFGPMVDLRQKADKDPENAKSYLKQLMDMSSELQECEADIRKEMESHDGDEDFENRVEKAVEKQCPEVFHHIMTN